jgi:hypothetical protein
MVEDLSRRLGEKRQTEANTVGCFLRDSTYRECFNLDDLDNALSAPLLKAGEVLIAQIGR